MINAKRRRLALFYCQNVPESRETDRQALEEACGETMALFPMPCSGRVEPVHLLRALEEFADAAYVITCPQGACRNFEGNSRAMKRMERTKSIIESIGLERERVGLIVCSKENPKSLATLAQEIVEDISSLGPSPALGPMDGN
jgi:F420-non-reducing hydrogenase iron-sulfur subunit